MKNQKDFLKVITLSLKELEEASTIVIRSFMKFNPIWSRFVKNPKDVEQYVKQQLQISINNKLTIGVLLMPEKKLACIGSVLDIVDYQKILSSKKQTGKYDQMTYYKEVSKIGDELQRQILSKVYKKGQVAYGNYIAINPEVNIKNIGFLGVAAIFYQASKMGFKKIVGKSSNKASMNLVLMLGGKQVKSLTHFDSQLKFYLFEQDLSNSSTFEQIVKHYQSISISKINDQQFIKQIKHLQNQNAKL